MYHDNSKLREELRVSKLQLMEKTYNEKVRMEKILKDILINKTDYLKKKENLKKLNYQNTWINVNQKILKIINEN